MFLSRGRQRTSSSSSTHSPARSINMAYLPSRGTKTPVLRHLRHLDPPHPSEQRRVRGHRRDSFEHVPKYVHPHDRIAYWNIVPGDIVKSRVGRVGQSHGLDPNIPQRAEGKVEAIDRKRNLLWLNPLDPQNPRIPEGLQAMSVRWVNPNKKEEGTTPNFFAVRRGIHYSNLMLKIPDLNIYAGDIRREGLHYSKRTKAFHWKRYIWHKREDGTVYKHYIPWPKIEREGKTVTKDAVAINTIQEESWLPWDPADPILLPMERPRDSPWSVQQLLEESQAKALKSGEPDAVEVAQKDAAQKKLLEEANEAVKSGDHNAVTAALNKAARVQQTTMGSQELAGPGGPKTTYAGFQTRSRPKPPKVAQLPSASELLTLAKESMASWARSRKVQNHIETRGTTFAPDDYLALSPTVGGLVSGQSPISSIANDDITLQRDITTGRLNYQTKQEANITTRRHLDSMPIELLMTGDLTNPNGLKAKMRRWKERKAVEKEQRREQEVQNRENLVAFKEYILQKKAQRDAAIQQSVE